MPPTGTDTPIPTGGMTYEAPTEPEAPSAVQARINEMREALTAGKTLAEAAAEREGAAAELESPEGESEESREGEGEGQEPKEAEGEPIAEPEGQEPKEQEGEEGEEGEEEEAEPIVVKLPPVRDGQTELEMEVSDQDAAERLNALINNGMRREEFKKQMAAIESQRAELDFIGTSLEVDPAGFIVERVNPEIQKDVVRELLARMPDKDFQALREALDEWETDPKDRELEALKLDKKRKDERTEATKRQREEQAKQERARAVVGAIETLIPESFDDDESDQFYQLSLHQIKKYVRQHDIKTLDPALVPGILKNAGVLRKFGIESVSRKPAAPPAAERKRSADSSADQKAKAQAGAERMKKRAATRRAASAVAPRGTGAAPQRVLPPKGQTIEQRIAWLRKNPGVLRSS